MDPGPHNAQHNPQQGNHSPETKLCAHCRLQKPAAEFLRRTGRRSGKSSRRGACRDCRMRKKQLERALSQHAGESAPPSLTPEAIPRVVHSDTPVDEPPPADVPKRRTKRPLPDLPPKPEGPDASELKPTRQGIIRMRGRKIGRAHV